jgi:uncharacterized protein YndB with AHSA1/START domain
MTTDHREEPDGSYREIDGRPALVFERRLAHPVGAVWRALTEPEQLRHWFPAAVTVDLREGGAMSFVFENEELPESSGQVTKLEPPHRFAFSWSGQDLHFDLEPAASGCLLRFTHFLEDRDAAARDAAGWHVCLAHLDRTLAGQAPGAPPSEPTDEWRGLYEKYLGAGLPSGAPVPD